MPINSILYIRTSSQHFPQLVPLFKVVQGIKIGLHVFYMRIHIIPLEWWWEDIP